MRLFFAISIFLSFFSTVASASAIDRRLQQEHSLQTVRFSIIPHKPTYLLPFNFNDKIQSYGVYHDLSEDEQLQQTEVKFQFSFKMPIFLDIADLPLSLYFAYTQVSFWQAYNSDNSSPFRETNYEPELFVSWVQNKPLIGGWNFKLATLNLTHQSNGKSDPLSRSWNRIESNLVFEKDNISLALTPWYRFEESSSDDNNPDLLDYYGHGEISAIYNRGDNTFTITSRNNIESGFSKGSAEFNWSFPIYGKMHGYFQLFSGYGNSLIEYNRYTNTVGLGISLTDWL